MDLEAVYEATDIAMSQNTRMSAGHEFYRAMRVITDADTRAVIFPSLYRVVSDATFSGGPLFVKDDVDRYGGELDGP